MKKSKEIKQEKTNRTSIGGQAVMEGIMMRGRTSMATAVRDPEGEIQIESERLPSPEKRSKFLRLPLIRGVVNFITSLIDGNRVLMRSADVALSEEEAQPSKASKWFSEEKQVNMNAFFNTIATVLGIVFALGIFVALPQFITGFLPFDAMSPGLDGLWFNLIEGGVRLTIFVIYILVISLIPDLRRVFMCHGAEHKTITCYEEGKELTVENVRGCSRVHDRCGTTFLFLVMIVSILVFSLVNVAIATWGIYTSNDKLNGLIRLGFKILMLPIVAGISYEFLRLLSKTKSKFFYIFKIPGLLLQRLTTREPEDGMIECAIAAFKEVLAMDADPTIHTKMFATVGKMSVLLESVKKRFAEVNVDEEDAEWIFALTLDVPKSSVTTDDKLLTMKQAKQILRIADERMTGRPLWYIIGDTDFCGYKIKVDERVLIPRPETEEMAMMAVQAAEDENAAILDMCTGSGAIAIAVYKELKKAGKNPKVMATDISAAALELAQENAKANEADILFVESDLFTRIRGKFDVIVTNPPYIPTAEIENLQREVKDFEPRLALDGGADGMDIYRRIAAEALTYLNKGGTLIMEVGEGEAQEIAKMFKGDVYTIVAQDFNGVERYVKVIK